MKMRQSLADWEQAFVKEISLDRHRRDSLRRTAEQRARKREVERRHKRGSVRFALLVLTLILDRGDRHRRDVPHALPAARLASPAVGPGSAEPCSARARAAAVRGALGSR